jgi:hypothetical protein
MRIELEKHLSVMRRSGFITDWHDRRIVPGEEWEAEIAGRIETADIIVLLVSSDFMASDYCYEKEMARALERHRAGDAVVVPVLLRPVDWKQSPLSALQALPKDARAELEGEGDRYVNTLIRVAPRYCEYRRKKGPVERERRVRKAAAHRSQSETRSLIGKDRLLSAQLKGESSDWPFSGPCIE